MVIELQFHSEEKMNNSILGVVISKEEYDKYLELKKEIYQ